MFDVLGNGTSYLRIRRIAVLLLAASLVLLTAIATYERYRQSSSADELFGYLGPNAVELGLAYGALLGSVLAVGLLVWSFVKQRRSKK